MSELTMADLPGVGPAFRQKLAKAGVNNPNQLVAKYLQVPKQVDLFSLLLVLTFLF